MNHRGEKNPNRVLTPRLVHMLVLMHELGFGYTWLSRWLGVTKSCVQMVLTGRSWSHVTGLKPPSKR
jgi:hypothetical protein